MIVLCPKDCPTVHANATEKNARFIHILGTPNHMRRSLACQETLPTNSNVSMTQKTKPPEFAGRSPVLTGLSPVYRWSNAIPTVANHLRGARKNSTHLHPSSPISTTGFLSRRIFKTASPDRTAAPRSRRDRSATSACRFRAPMAAMSRLCLKCCP
jgi:hypothetical protein